MKFSSTVRIVFAFGWLVTVSVLFFLPGSTLPAHSWLQKIAFDKWVHAGIFILLYLLWSWALNLRSIGPLVWLLLASAVYGLLVECIQERWIMNRSFDWGDVGADILGSVLGWMIWLRSLKK